MGCCDRPESTALKPMLTGVRNGGGCLSHNEDTQAHMAHQPELSKRVALWVEFWG